jgi:hypothetical protein
MAPPTAPGAVAGAAPMLPPNLRLPPQLANGMPPPTAGGMQGGMGPALAQPMPAANPLPDMGALPPMPPPSMAPPMPMGAGQMLPPGMTPPGMPDDAYGPQGGAFGQGIEQGDALSRAGRPMRTRPGMRPAAPMMPPGGKPTGGGFI